MLESKINSESINQKRWKKFKSIKRGYYSFILIIGLYLLSFLLPILVSSKALVVNYEGKFYFPAFRDVMPGMNSYYDGSIFDQEEPGEMDQVLQPGGPKALGQRLFFAIKIIV